MTANYKLWTSVRFAGTPGALTIVCSIFFFVIVLFYSAKKRKTARRPTIRRAVKNTSVAWCYGKNVVFVVVVCTVQRSTWPIRGAREGGDAGACAQLVYIHRNTRWLIVTRTHTRARALAHAQTQTHSHTRLRQHTHTRTHGKTRRLAAHTRSRAQKASTHTAVALVHEIRTVRVYIHVVFTVRVVRTGFPENMFAVDGVHAAIAAVVATTAAPPSARPSRGLAVVPVRSARVFTDLRCGVPSAAAEVRLA